MADLDQIIQGMVSQELLPLNPLNTSDAPRITINWFFSGTTPSEILEDEFTGWTALSDAEQAAVLESLAHIETFANVNFQQISELPEEESGVVLEIGKAKVSVEAAGEGGFFTESADNDISAYYGAVVFGEEYDLSDLKDMPDLILHELGHALGLEHPFEEPVVPEGTDNAKYSLMSYTPNPDNGMLGDAMAQYDILGLQQIWGAADYNTDDTTYTGSRAETLDTVWDTDGIDTFDASDAEDRVAINLRQGEFSQFGDYEDVSIAFGTVIENAIGSNGGDLIRGNSTANALSGGRGDDAIRGNGGADTIKGGGGGDILFGGKGKDKISGGGGQDTVIGGAGRDVLIGGSRSDTFIFREGYDRDVIRDFRDNVDVIDLTDFGFDTAEDALEFATQRDSGVVFNFGDGDRLKVNDATLTGLADDLLV